MLKCFPILYLIALCYCAQDTDSLSSWVLMGLVASMAGDLCLNWFKTLFLPGVFFFTLAHVFYIQGFGFTPFGQNIALLFGVFALIVAAVILMNSKHMATGLASAGYVFIICTMGWRSVVFYQTQRTTASFAGAAGAITFILSDSLIAINMNPSTRMSHGELYIMTTYYVAQLLITVSVLMNSWEKI